MATFLWKMITNHQNVGTLFLDKLTVLLFISMMCVYIMYTYTYKHMYIYTHIYIYIDMYVTVSVRI